MSRVAKIALLSALAACCAESVAQAAGFVDPTRPPNAVREGSASESAETRLQSVLIAPGRRVAVIDGQSVSVGEKYGDATVLRISEGEVVLKQGDEIRTLKLLPDVEKVRRKRAASIRHGGKEASK